MQEFKACMAVVIAINKAEAEGDSDDEIEEAQSEDEVCAHALPS